MTFPSSCHPLSRIHDQRLHEEHLSLLTLTWLANKLHEIAICPFLSSAGRRAIHDQQLVANLPGHHHLVMLKYTLIEHQTRHILSAWCHLALECPTLQMHGK
uniref:OVA1 n=1 Tax=Arundo donax TaxID=35708 RepID=A0A0A9I1V7_ARUDO